ncbi:MAG: glycosyltransferase family 39 protein [Lachnospiraceae bacterium]|nr:glycosyltransferase family 39 protein [Lachnospiraceae bacterium]
MKNKIGLEKLLPLLLLGMGAILRLAYLGTVPGGMHQDETFVAWNAFALWQEGMDSAGNIFPIYLADWGDGHSALYSWLLIPIYMLVGETNITPFITRLPQAIVGIFTLWIVYLLLKKMFGRKCGCMGLFLLAICPWHVMMCRWGLDANLAPAFLIFGLYFFVLGLENKKLLLLAAFFYGIGLYSYAVIWPIVPVMLLLQIIYGVYLGKLNINKWSVLSVLLLAILAFPLLLFVGINSFGNGQQIELPFMTIPVMGGYRAEELAISIPQMWGNIRRVLTLLWHQNVGAPHDILLPHGLFYDIGRVFIVVGFFVLIKNMVKKLGRKELSYEVFIFVQLIGAGIVCAIVYVYLHQVNCLYIPLVLLETYGVWAFVEWLKKFKKYTSQVVMALLIMIYLVNLFLFQKDYYGGYKELVGTYYHQGVEEAVEYAMEQGDEIMVEKGAQWPRILLFSRTLPSEYLSSVEYALHPAPAQFSNGEDTFYITTDYENIEKDKVYIIYFIDKDKFAQEFELTRFHDWYVAVPK